MAERAWWLGPEESEQEFEVVEEERPWVIQPEAPQPDPVLEDPIVPVDDDGE